MKRTLTTCFCMMLLGGAAMAQNYQIPNSDFEIWNDVNEPGNGWYSFVSANATDFFVNIGKNAAKKNTTKVVGRTGSAVQIVSTSIVGAKANGNLTSGRINMGSTTPTNAANHNFTSRSGSANNCAFVGLPDSVSCWTKFTRGEDGEYFAQGNFVLHGDIDYKDPHETEANVTAYRVAGGTIKIAPSADWTYLSTPMVYTGTEAEKMYMLGSFTTNPAQGATAGDRLQIDDVVFIYNSKLASLSIKGTPLEGFDKNTYIYIIKGELPSGDDIVAVSDGKGAQVNIQESDDVVKIIVTGNDGAQNQHIYSLVKEGTTFSATSIKLNDVELDGFDPKVFSYENIEMLNGIYPTVSVSSDRTLTSVDMQLNEAAHTITIVVTDKMNKKDYVYTLKFTPSDRIANGSQIKGGFEVQTQWGPDAIDENRWGTVADGWFSSNVTQMGTMNFVMVEKESYQVGDDLYAVKTVNGRPGALGVESNAPGYIAIGTPWVYADMIGLMSTVFPGGAPDTDDSDGGTIGGVNFTYQPDSIVGYYKRTYAGAESGLLGMNPKEDAKIIAYLWKGTSASMAPATDGFNTTGSAWQLLVDREIDILGTKNGGTPADGVTLIASAEETVKELADWTRVAVPLNYVSDEKPEKANVVISSADYFNRANIGNGNTLSADDVEFIYNSKLASITIDGVALEGFNKDTDAYELDGTAPTTTEGIVAIPDGKGANVEVTVNGKVVTIKVKGNDFAENASNLHTYTLTFKFATGIDQNVENAVSVKGITNGAIVEGVQLGERVDVYSVQGILVGQYTANGTLNINDLNSNTVYLVKIGSYVTRVLTK